VNWIAEMTTKPKTLVLYNGPTSPFARMAFVVAIELGIVFKDQTIDVYSAAFLDKFNPLRQVPTLVIDGKDAIFDSRSIFAYFDAVSNKPSILPNDDFEQTTRISLFLGLTDACLQYRMASVLPAEERSETTIEKLLAKINRTLDFLEKSAEQTTSGDLRLGQIVAACALEYIDYRYSSNWRRRSPKLNSWVNQFSKRTSMMNSRPSD
jgi:glutathione S-transferase